MQTRYPGKKRWRNSAMRGNIWKGFSMYDIQKSSVAKFSSAALHGRLFLHLPCSQPRSHLYVHQLYSCKYIIQDRYPVFPCKRCISLINLWKEKGLRFPEFLFQNRSRWYEQTLFHPMHDIYFALRRCEFIALSIKFMNTSVNLSLSPMISRPEGTYSVRLIFFSLPGLSYLPEEPLLFHQ